MLGDDAAPRLKSPLLLIRCRYGNETLLAPPPRLRTKPNAEEAQARQAPEAEEARRAEDAEAASSQLYRNPQHPYTQSLLSAIPAANPEVNVQPEVLEGDVPSPVHPPRGCSFHTRCRYRTDICAEVRPVLEKEREGHRIACHNPPSG